MISDTYLIMLSGKNITDLRTGLVKMDRNINFVNKDFNRSLIDQYYIGNPPKDIYFDILTKYNCITIVGCIFSHGIKVSVE